MDEYIKREDALDALLYALVGTGYQSRAMDAIKDVPTADVVPKSEVIKEFAERLKKYYSILPGQTPALSVAYYIDQIAKEMLKTTEGGCYAQDKKDSCL